MEMVSNPKHTGRGKSGRRAQREKGRGVARKSSAKSMKVTKIMTYLCSECETSSVYMYAE